MINYIYSHLSCIYFPLMYAKERIKERVGMNRFKNFGDFIAQKRFEQAITVRRIAEMIDVSPGYYNDIEKGRRNPPDKETLDKFISALHLNEEESLLLFDLAGRDRDEVSPDLPDYIMENDVVRVALRIAKEKASEDDWQRFIKDLEKK